MLHMRKLRYRELKWPEIPQAGFLTFYMRQPCSRAVPLCTVQGVSKGRKEKKVGAAIKTQEGWAPGTVYRLQPEPRGVKEGCMKLMPV